MNPRRLVAAASVTLIALIFLCVAWELWLAPLRAGGSMLVLKVLPLLAALFGTLRGRRYTSPWASLLSLPVSYTPLPAHQTVLGFVFRLLL